MKAATPKISVGMPIYNGEPFIEEAIRSVLNQTFDDFELIICDNASTDRTEEICKAYASQDHRVQYHRNERNVGAAGNYTRVFERSRAPYFRWANADDVSGQRLHERCLGVLEENPDAVLAYGKTQIIDEFGSITRDYDDNLDLQQARPSERFVQYFKSVGMCHVLFGLMRRGAVAQTSLMGDGSLRAPDLRLMAELTLLGKFIEIPEVLFFRRMHEAAMNWDREDSERQRQFWSAGAKRFSLPHWRTNLTYLGKVFTLPLEFSERWRIARIVLRRMIGQRCKLAEDIVQWARR